jgi:hypothetical protein
VFTLNVWVKVELFTVNFFGGAKLFTVGCGKLLGALLATGE